MKAGIKMLVGLMAGLIVCFALPTVAFAQNGLSDETQRIDSEGAIRISYEVVQDEEVDTVSVPTTISSGGASASSSATPKTSDDSMAAIAVMSAVCIAGVGCISLAAHGERR